MFFSLSKPEWSNITQHLVVDSVYSHYMPHVCFKSSNFEIDAPYEKNTITVGFLLTPFIHKPTDGSLYPMC